MSQRSVAGWQGLIALGLILVATRGFYASSSASTHSPTLNQVRVGDSVIGLIAILALLVQLHLGTESPWGLYAWMTFCIWIAARHAQTHSATQTLLRYGWKWPVILASLLLSALDLMLQFELWERLSFGYHDIGLFARALESATRGRGLHVDSLGHSILGEHAFLALWVFVPLCKLGMKPFLLIMLLSTVALRFTAILCAWYMYQKTKSNAAAILAGIAWLLLPMTGCLIVAHGYGFHESYLAVPLLFLGFALGGLKRYVLASVVLLTTLLIREDLALTVAAWAIYIALVKGRKRLGLAVFFISLGYLLAAVYLIVPHYRQAPYPHIGFHFSDLIVFSSTSLAISLSFLVTLLLPMAFLPLRDWRFSLVAVPAIAETLLTTNLELHNIGFQYYVPAIAVFYYAALDGWIDPSCNRLHGKPGNGSRHAQDALSISLRPGWCLLVAAAIGNIYLGIGPLSNNPLPITAHPTLQASFHDLQRLRESIPTSASVTASYRIAAHFLDADRLWTVANEQLGDFIVVHDADIIDEHKPRSVLKLALHTGMYQPIHADYHLVVLARQHETSPLSREIVSHDIPDDVSNISLDLGEGIQLVAMAIRPADKPGHYLVTLVWTISETVTRDYRFGLVHENLRWGPFYFARGAFPTDTWMHGLYYRDEVVLATIDGSAIRPDRLHVVLLE